MVGIQATSVSRPLKELKEAEVVHQDKARGPYRVDEKVAEDLYKFRSIKGEFGRDEEAKAQARDQRKHYGYQVKLQGTILQLLEDGKNPGDALKEAKKLVLPSRSIAEHELHKRQEWAFNGAQKEQKKAQARKHPKQTGKASRANVDARLRRDIREGYFHERQDEQRSPDGDR
jgi:hypothetical protein